MANYAVALFLHAPTLRGEQRRPESALWMGQRSHGSIHLVYRFWKQARACRMLTTSLQPCICTRKVTCDDLYQAISISTETPWIRRWSIQQSSHLFNEACRWPSHDPAESGVSWMPLRRFAWKLWLLALGSFENISSKEGVQEGSFFSLA